MCLDLECCFFCFSQLRHVVSVMCEDTSTFWQYKHLWVVGFFFFYCFTRMVIYRLLVLCWPHEYELVTHTLI